MSREKLVAFHLKNGYYVHVQKVDGENSINVTYPNNIIDYEDPANYSVLYIIGEDNTVTKESTVGGISGVSNIQVPSYAIRIAVTADILLTCTKLGIDASLVENFDKDGVNLVSVKTLELLALEEPEMDLKKEKPLRNIFNKMVSGEDCLSLARANDVEEGYAFLIELFNMGGF